MTGPFGPGDRFGAYRLGRLLGGGMSSVFEAVRIPDGARVALKILRAEAFAVDELLRARLAREAHALRAIDHASLPAFVDAGEADGHHFLATRFVDGVTLAARIEQQLAAGRPGPLGYGPGDLVPLLRTVAAIADALHALHTGGFVHRDVKPSNILVGTDGHAWLLDLGLVRLSDDNVHRLTRTGQIVGTPAMLAPEQIDACGSRIGPRTDVHGLAATLFTCLTLRHPFAAPTPSAVLDNILHAPAPDPRASVPALPASLTALLGRALAKDPRNRPASAAVFAAELRAVACGRRPGFWRSGPHAVITGVRERARRGRRLLGCALLLAVVARDNPGAPARAVATDAAARLEAIDQAIEQLAAIVPPRPDNAPVLVQAIAAAEQLVAASTLADAADGTEDPGLREVRQRYSGRLDELRNRVLPRCRDRLDWLRHAEQAADTSKRAWSQAAEHVAADPRFQGFRLTPQFGLVPLEPDPKSGLCEFHDLASADCNASDPLRDGDGLHLAPSHGMVLVLVPPPTSSLPPFLIGKHEVTRVQWMRITGGDDPSRYQIGAPYRAGSVDAMSPVDRVAWPEAVRELGLWGYSLPTGPQWQFAATAGDLAHTEALLRGTQRHVFANIVDRSFVRALPGALASPADDGYFWPAPVGSFAPNEFGLHDAFGNLWEWTQDVVRGPAGELVVARGGAYDTQAPDCRVDYRFTTSADQRLENVGLRAVRALAVDATTGGGR